MTKRKFFSIKYQKYILPEDKNFWNIARDEAVYRLDENLSRLPRRMRWLAPLCGGLPRRMRRLVPLSGALQDKKMNCPGLGHMEEREKLEKFLKHFKIKN
jgi:hypothetical protein